jgi:non-ribosomal peptide synthetase component F
LRLDNAAVVLVPGPAVLSYGAVLNQIRWAESTYGLTSADVILSAASIASGGGLYDCLLASALGARLVLAVPGADAESIAPLLRANSVTYAELELAVLESLRAADAAAALASIRELRCDLTSIDAQLFAALRRGWNGRLTGGYSGSAAAGPVTALTANGERDADGPLIPVPVGYPVWNTRVYALDSRLRPVPAGVAGELYVAGARLARTHGRAEVTAGQFVPDPYGITGSRMLRTGLRVRWNTVAGADAELVYADRWHRAYTSAPVLALAAQAGPDAGARGEQPPNGQGDASAAPSASAPWTRQMAQAGQQLEAGEPVHNVPVLIPIAGTMNIAALHGALADVVERHEVLRTIYPEHDGVGFQEVIPMAQTHPALRIAQVPESDFAALLTDLVRAPFDVTTQVPLRAGLALMSSVQSVLALVLHPNALNYGGDLGLSNDSLTHEVLAAYAARTPETSAEGHPETPGVAELTGSIPRVAGPAIRATDTDTLGAVLTAAAERYATAVAVVYEGRELTYADLDAASARMARALIGRGIGAEDVVAVIVPRSEQSVLAAWAIAKTGGVVAELDPVRGPSQLARLLVAGGVVAGVTTAALRPGLPDVLDWIVIDDPGMVARMRRNSAAPLSVEEIERPVLARNLAWISRPPATELAVLVAHTGIADMAMAQRDQFSISETSRILHAAVPGSGAALFEILVAASAGAAVVVAAPDVTGGSGLEALLRQERITHAWMVPNLAELGRSVVDDLGIVTIGAGATTPDTSTWLLDSELHPTLSVAGTERYLRGTGVGRGIHAEPGLTACQFVADPGGPPGARMARAYLAAGVWV